jgi:putative transposase
MYKSLTVPVNCSKEDYDYLLHCNKYSAIIWNMCVQSDKEHKESGERYLGLSGLEKLTKRQVPHILANSINSVVIRYISARSSAFEAISVKNENSKNVKLPYKEKKYYNTSWCYQNIKINKERGYITLGKPLKYTEYSYYKQQPIKCYLKSIPDNIVEVELVYRNKLYLAIKYKLDNDNVLIQSNNHAAIDLGEIHSIATIDNNGNALNITGRKIRSIKRLRNKEQGKIQRRRSKCAKGSKQYNKYTKALYNLKYKTERQIRDAIHKTTKLYLDYCLKNQISKVYYGDLDKCTRGTKQKHHANEMVRGKLSQWEYGHLTHELQNKLCRYGIEMIKVDEFYSSKKCPMCEELHTPKGRNYECNCGYKQHRDVVGAINLLNDNYGSTLKQYSSKKYLRIE